MTIFGYPPVLRDIQTYPHLIYAPRGNSLPVTEGQQLVKRQE